MPEEFNDAEPLLRVNRGLSIRPLLHSDAAVVARYGNNIKITRNMTNRFPFPYSLDDAHGFIAHVRDRKTWRPLHTPSKPEAIPAESIRQVLDGRLAPVHWAIALNGKYIGNMGFEFGSDVEEHTAKLGYWIAEEHWGHGYGTEVMRAVVAWAWQVYPELKRLEAAVYSWNPASTKVLQKIGFVEEGRLRAAISKMGKTCDMIVFGQVRDALEITTTAPAAEPSS